jgi:putative membrane protein
MMLHFWETHWGQLASALIFSTIGILMFGLAFIMMRKILPFNIYKELEEDQNIALGILMASVMIGIAIIISSAIR